MRHDTKDVPKAPAAVALFPAAYLPSLGGIEQLTRQLAAEHLRRGRSSVVFAMRWPKTLPSDERIDAVHVHREVFRTPEWTPRHLAGWALHARTTELRITRLARAAGSAVIHVHGVSGNAYYAQRVARRLRVPLVVSLHGELTMDADHIYETSHVLPRLLGSLMRHADAVTACSRQTLEEAIRFTGVDPGGRARVVYNSVDLDEFGGMHLERDARPYVLAIGRHVHEKGFDTLLSAFAAASANPTFNHDLVLAGDGPCSADLRAQAMDLGLAHRVTFSGRCDRPRTAALFAGCSYFVLPSRHEPLGIVNLEAMAAGKAIVATSVGGVPEIITDGDNGLLVPPDDVRALAGAVLRLGADGALRAELGSNGRTRAEQFAWPRVADEFDTIYAEVLR